MTSPFFSIIVPIYNVEPYIARCMNSIINQTFKDLEIVIIDDCGSDKSMEIVKKYANRDKRIKIFHNSCNLGLFHTRIEGEKRACGEYILHIDSDDFIKLETCEILHKRIQEDYQESEQWCDICCFGMDFYPKTWKKMKPKIATTTLRQNQIFYEFFIAEKTCSWSLATKALKRSMLNQINILILKHLATSYRITMFEDALKFFIIALFSQKSIGLDRELYYYCDSSSSITRSFDEESIQKKVNQIQEIIKIFYDFNIKTDHPYFQQAKEKLIKFLQSSSILEERYRKSWFAYPIACLKSLQYYKKWQTYVRLLAYFLSFGRVKI